MTVVLVVLDGFGIGDDPERNALMAAPMWNWHRLMDEFPHAQLGASGADVGLPDGQMGNSEVGHLNLGAGRVVMQDLVRINVAIENGSFFENPAFLDACAELGYPATDDHNAPDSTGAGPHPMGVVPPLDADGERGGGHPAGPRLHRQLHGRQARRLRGGRAHPEGPGGRDRHLHRAGDDAHRFKNR